MKSNSTKPMQKRLEMSTKMRIPKRKKLISTDFFLIIVTSPEMSSKRMRPDG